MNRGPAFIPAKLFGESSKAGGSVPVAKIFLPQDEAATPILLVASGNGNRRVAEVRPRRVT